MKKRITNRLVWLLVLCLVFTLGLSACGSGDGGDSAGGEDGGDTIKIGAIYPTTGNYALLGNESLKGLQLAVEEWNAKGGIAGKKIELVVTDAPDTTAAQTEAERLINKEEVKILCGAYSSALANVISDVCARYEVPYFEMGGIAADVLEKGYKYLWRTCADAYGFGDAAVEFFDKGCIEKMYLDKGTVKIAIVHEDSNYGTCVAEAEKEGLAAAGYKTANIKVTAYSSTSADLSTVILDLKSYMPDVVFATSYANDSVLFARQAKELGFDIPLLIGAGGGHSLASTKDALGNDIYGFYTSDFPQYRVEMKGNEDLAAYVESYKKKFGSEPLSGHSLTNYNGANMMLSVIEKAEGDLEKDAIYEAATAIDIPLGTYPGGWGCKFREDGQNERAPVTVSMWTPDTLDTVWPLDMALTEFVAPMPTWAEKAKM